MDKKFEIITFKDGDYSLPVNVSPTEDTVWLSADDIGNLFERDTSVINKHIRNIYSEGELLEISTQAKNASMLNGREYITKLYNLDVIISVGYRVKSQRGLIFRKWATTILRNYIFQQNPCTECKEKIIDLQNQIYEIKELQRHEIKYEKGDKLQGYLSIKHFLETAKQSIYIIDDYFDHSFDEVLKEISVDTTIITDPNNQIESNEIYIVKKTKAFHDRFIFVDGVGYHLGCSLKDIGNSLAIATRLESIKLSDLLKLIK